MNNTIVDFYFTYLSPYAYLANTRIKKALGPLDVTLHYQPIAHTGSSDGPVFSEARYEHIVEEDVPQFADGAEGFEPWFLLTVGSGTAAAGFVADGGPLLILLVLQVTVAVGLYHFSNPPLSA